MTAQALTAARAADQRDAYLFSLYAKARWTRRGWLMILSGLAGFDRNPT